MGGLSPVPGAERLTGDFSPSSQSCSSASARHAASMRLYSWWVGSSWAASAKWAQFCAFSRNMSDCFDFMSCLLFGADNSEQPGFNNSKHEDFVTPGGPGFSGPLAKMRM
jgi:hypothetical protein